MAEPIITQPAKVDDFSGGLTDNFIAGPSNKFQKGDNFVIDDNKKLASRDGSGLFDVGNPQLPAGEKRLISMSELEGQLFQHTERNLYYISGGSFSTLTGPSSNPVLGAGTTAGFASYAKWKNHQFVTNDEGSSVMKMYKDPNGNFQVSNLGLPGVVQAGAIELANDLKAKYNAHIADVAQHTASADSTNVITSPDATELDSLFTLVTEMITDYVAHDDDAELAAGHVFHAGQEAADHSLSSTTAPTSLTEIITFLDDFKTKFNAHDNDAGAHGVTGSHQSSEEHTPTVTPSLAGANSFVYGFVLKYEYTIGSVVFIERGPFKLVSISNGGVPQTNQHDIADIPTLVNGTTENFDTANVMVEIYRTQSGGSTLYKVGEVTNGTAVFTDNVADSTIINNITAYIEGDVLDNDPPPKAKFIINVNDITWYGGITEGNVSQPQRIRHSNKGAPGSCPESHFEDLDDDITGIGHINVFPIYFTTNKVYRLEGFYDTTGRGFIRKRELSNTVGCVSHRSIVQVKNGLFFASQDGFYFCDGFKVERISESLNETYKSLVTTTTQADRMFGVYDEINDRILWAVQQGQSSNDNETIFVCHLRFGVKPDMAFTTWSGGNVPDNFQPSCLFFQNEDELLRGDRRGYLFKHTTNDLDDPKIDTLVSPSTWLVRPIIFDYQSVASDFNMSDVRKWIPRTVVTLDNISNTSIELSSQNDVSGAFSNLKEIRYRDNIVWGDQVVEWGPASDSIRWDFFPVIEQWRRFPSGGLRASLKQVRMTNSLTVIQASDIIGLATLDNVAKTVTLESAPTFKWDDESIDYFISFSDDSFLTQFLITGRTDSVLTIADSGDKMPTGSGIGWEMRGIKKGDKLRLLSYVVMFSPLSMTQDTFRSGDSGENA